MVLTYKLLCQQLQWICHTTWQNKLLCLSDVEVCVHSSSVYVHVLVPTCKQSKTGSVEGLGTRLHLSVCVHVRVHECVCV